MLKVKKLLPSYILQIQNAKAEGTKAILLAMKDAGVDDQVLALCSMEALEKVAEGDASKLIIPSDTINFLGTFKGIKEVLSTQ